jgi:hypothetical protein
MALAVALPVQVSVTSTTVNLSDTGATGGVGPYTYQWYRSTTSGFSPGAGSLIAGATSLTLADTGLIPNTLYYYVLVATDTGNGNATANSAQLAVTTAATTLNPNQFAQTPIVGMIDLRFDYDTVSVLIDVSQATPLYAGMAVKVVQSSDGVPKVVGCAADSDNVFGFINFDIKTIQYVAGNAAEISQAGNVMYLYATGAILRGTQVTLDLTTGGGIAQATGSSGNSIVGWAFDQAAAAGALIRVKLTCPSFTLD